MICCVQMTKALKLLGGYTAGQWGLVTTRQARQIGVEDVTLHRLKMNGLLESVRPGVHATTSANPSAERPEQAAWLSLHPDAAGWERPKLDLDGGVISHRSAALLHDLGELVNTRIEITVPRRRTTRDPGVWLRKAELTESEVTVLNGLPVTTPMRTIRDLLDQHLDGSHIASIIRQAVEAGRVQLDVLADQVEPYARRYGVKPSSGRALLESFLAQIGMSVHELAQRPSPAVTWDDLADLRWETIEDMGVTWGQLASLSPEIAQRLKRAGIQPELR